MELSHKKFLLWRHKSLIKYNKINKLTHFTIPVNFIFKVIYFIIVFNIYYNNNNIFSYKTHKFYIKIFLF